MIARTPWPASLQFLSEEDAQGKGGDDGSEAEEAVDKGVAPHAKGARVCRSEASEVQNAGLQEASRGI